MPWGAALRWAVYGAAAVALMLSASGAVARLGVALPWFVPSVALAGLAGAIALATRPALAGRFGGMGQLRVLGGLLLLANVAVQATGGVQSPLFLAYAMVGIVLCWRFGVLAGVVAAGLVAVCETASLFTVHGLPSRLPELASQLATLCALTFGIGGVLRYHTPRSAVQAPAAPAERTEIESPHVASAEDGILSIRLGSPAEDAAKASFDEAAREADRNVGELLELARVAIGAYTAAYFRNESDGRLHLRAHRSASLDVLDPCVVTPTDSYVGLSLLQRRIVHLRELTPASARGLPYYARLEAVRTMLAIPVRTEGEIEGVLVVDSAARDAFSDEEQAILESVAEQIAFSRRAVRTRQEAQRVTDAVQRLFEAGRDLVRPVERGPALEAFLGGATRLTRADGAFVAFVEDAAPLPDAPPAPPKLAVHAARGFRPDFAERAVFDLADGSIARALESAEPLVVPSPAEIFAMPVGAIASYAPVGSWLLVPLALPSALSGPARPGVLAVSSRNRSHFGSLEIALAQSFADHAIGQLRSLELLRRHEALATTDGLTGLPNHRFFHEKLADELVRAGRAARPLTLLLLDLDQFKRFNEAHGHPAGDRILKRVAALLRETIRRGPDTAVRFGGEEFAVILPDQEPGKAFEVADRIRRAAAETLVPGDGGDASPLTLSIGLATFPHDAVIQGDLVQRAEESLAHAKRHGRNRVSLYGAVRLRAEGVSPSGAQPQLF